MEKTLYLGMPGSGKTTTLLNLLEKELEHISPQKIAYVSFTRKAVQEAQDRAFARFNLTKKQMPYFKTLHALAFNALGLSKSDVMDSKHLKQLSQELGVDLTENSCVFQPLALYNLARVKGKTLFEIWGRTYSIHTKTWDELEYVIRCYKNFKKQHALIDFTDMIIMFNKQNSAFPVEIAFVDEAQDLSAMQWKMLDIGFKNVKKLILAGDDDQCIYSWSGAEKKRFLEFEGNKIILDKSYRCPQVVADFANVISGKITKRYTKNLYGHQDGSIIRLNSFEELVPKLSSGQWLLLVRNRVHFKQLTKLLKEHHFTYILNEQHCISFQKRSAILGLNQLLNNEVVSGEVAENIAYCAGKDTLYFDHQKTYCLSDIFKEGIFFIDHIDPRDLLVKISAKKLAYYYGCLNRGLEDFLDPRITVSTIHGAKGAECDNVVLCCDQSILTYKGYQHQPDNEHRVFYVAVTRTKKNLYLLPNTRKRYYQFPVINGVRSNETA